MGRRGLGITIFLFCRHKWFVPLKFCLACLRHDFWIMWMQLLEWAVPLVEVALNRNSATAWTVSMRPRDANNTAVPKSDTQDWKAEIINLNLCAALIALLTVNTWTHLHLAIKRKQNTSGLCTASEKVISFPIKERLKWATSGLSE